MHGQENHALFNGVSDPGMHPDFSPDSHNLYGAPLCYSPFHGIFRINFQKGAGKVFLELVHFSGAGHGMPLIPYPSGSQNKRKFRGGFFIIIFWAGKLNLCATVWGRKFLVRKKAFGSTLSLAPKRPLYRTLIF